MKLQFVGAATTVTGSQFLLTTGQARVVVDCGMFQGSPSEVARNRIPFPYEPQTLDALLLTHAHLDHCGLTPLLVKGGFRGPIYATRATCQLVELVLLDSAKLQVEQAKDRRRWAERKARRASRTAIAEATDAEAVAAELQDVADPEEALRKQPPEVETQIEEPLYDVDDARQAISLLRPIEYEQAVDVATGIRAVFRDAGHILGSAIIVVDAEEAEASRRIVFSGDVGRPNTPIIRDPTAITEGADYVLVESTYGGREHDPEQEAVQALADAVKAVAGTAGVLLIPSFAIGRTQEVVWVLDRLLDDGRIPKLPLYLDSPMASKASDIYRAFPGYYDEQTQRLLEAGESPLDYPDQHITNRAEDSKAIARASRPIMIVASNGMLTGGRVVHHLRDIIGDPRAILLFVGYQGQGTLGAHLQAGATKVKIDGQPHQVLCAVRSISGFSAHADESELLDWLRHFAAAPRRPRLVFLVHGDPDAEAALAPRVAELGLEPYRPKWREEVELQ
jgi:metallo-beta-lactamase family protein